MGDVFNGGLVVVLDIGLLLKEVVKWGVVVGVLCVIKLGV